MDGVSAGGRGLPLTSVKFDSTPTAFRADEDMGHPRRPDAMNHPVCLGPCGWSYKEWSGAFYPKGTTPAKQLPYVAERYPVVEVDSTFYRSPSRTMVEGWRDRTPAGFGFSLKVPQVITHERMLLDCDDEVSRFL